MPPAPEPDPLSALHGPCLIRNSRHRTDTWQAGSMPRVCRHAAPVPRNL